MLFLTYRDLSSRHVNVIAADTEGRARQRLLVESYGPPEVLWIDSDWVVAYEHLVMERAGSWVTHNPSETVTCYCQSCREFKQATCPHWGHVTLGYCSNCMVHVNHDLRQDVATCADGVRVNFQYKKPRERSGPLEVRVSGHPTFYVDDLEDARDVVISIFDVPTTSTHDDVPLPDLQ